MTTRQFGAPIILTPFNYRFGRIGGIEFTGNYTVRAFSTYANLAVQTAHGKDVESSQFNFAPEDLAYIANNYIHLDHEERVSASAGVAYTWLGTRASLNMFFGTGLRSDTSWLVPRLRISRQHQHPERRSLPVLHAVVPRPDARVPRCGGPAHGAVRP